MDPVGLNGLWYISVPAKHQPSLESDVKNIHMDCESNLAEPFL